MKLKDYVILFICAVSIIFACKYKPHDKRLVHKTTDKPGYCYKDDGVWYVFYMNPNGTYYYSGSYVDFVNYAADAVSDWTPTESSISNYSSMPSEAQSSVEATTTESSGESTGGSTGESSGNTSGTSESSGESSGGSDSGGSDGGGDGGGGGD